MIFCARSQKQNYCRLLMVIEFALFPFFCYNDLFVPLWFTTFFWNYFIPSYFVSVVLCFSSFLITCWAYSDKYCNDFEDQNFPNHDAVFCSIRSIYNRCYTKRNPLFLYFTRLISVAAFSIWNCILYVNNTLAKSSTSSFRMKSF